MAKTATQRANKPEELTSFIVTVNDREAIGSVALKLEALGIDVERVMKRTGVLGGAMLTVQNTTQIILSPVMP